MMMFIQHSLLKLGTLGAGNHYAEIQVVDEIFDNFAAKKMGVDHKGQVSYINHVTTSQISGGLPFLPATIILPSLSRQL